MTEVSEVAPVKKRGLLGSSFVVSMGTLLSRVLGLVRDVVFANLLGAAPNADAFFVAFRLPNTFRRLFAEGTFNAAFIPSYTSQKVKSNKESKKFADEAIVSLAVLGPKTGKTI